MLNNFITYQKHVFGHMIIVTWI